MNTPKYTTIAARLRMGAKFCLKQRKHLINQEYFYFDEIPNANFERLYRSHWIRNEKNEIVGSVLRRQSIKNKFFLIHIYSGLVASASASGIRTKLMFEHLTFEVEI